MNQTAEKVLGYSKTEVVGRDIRDLQTTGTGEPPPTENHSPDPWFLTKLSEGKMWEGPLSCLRKTGDRVPLASKVAPVSFSKNHTTNQIIYVKVTTPFAIPSPFTTFLARTLLLSCGTKSSTRPPWRA